MSLECVDAVGGFGGTDLVLRHDGLRLLLMLAATEALLGSAAWLEPRT